MSIVTEDGTGLSGANSYASEAELTAYADDRGIVLSGLESELLLNAMDYLESLNFIGTKKTKDQPLQWPRDGVNIDGFDYPSTELPGQLKAGQLAVAVAIDEGNGPLSTVARGVKSEKADVVEIEYQDNAADTAIVRTINAALKKLLVGGGGFRVIRA